MKGTEKMAGTVSDNNWLALAENDLATAQAMLETTQGLYLQIGLQCHRAIDKILRASYAEQYISTPVETDGLLHLVADLPLKGELDARMLQTLEWLNTYPILESMDAKDLGDLAALLTQDRTAELLARTKELFEWIKAKL